MKQTMNQSNFTFDPKEHVYTLDGKPMTGMTTILGVLNKPALVQWAADMAVDYAIENARGCEIVEDGENKGKKRWFILDETLKEARLAHRKKKEDAAAKGTDTHALVEEYINDCIGYGGEALWSEDFLSAKGQRYYAPIQAFIDWAQREKIRFLASELQVYSRDLWVAGTMDFLFEKDGKKYIGDLKTYKKIWDRVPMFQCAGYGYLYKEMHGEDIAGYVVFNLPKERAHDPSQDVRWSFDVEGDTKAFMACVELYRQLSNWK